MYYGEKFNSISHLIGSVLALIGMGSLMTVGIKQNDPWVIASYSIFGFTLILLYTMSTLYHSFYSPKLKAFFRKMDHLSIYLLIAGTYTPYMLVSLRTGNGPLLLGIVWALAVFGCLLELRPSKRNEKLQICIFLLMGWLVVIEWQNLKLAISSIGMIWLTAGGLAYSLGIFFYILDHRGKLRHSHGIWHLFVLIGSLCHFISIIAYVG